MQKFGLNSNQIKIIALLCMLLDHCYVVLPFISNNSEWMTCIGRIAYPLFAFELVQGYRHTHDRRAYALRLAALAAISELPFDLAAYGVWFYPFHQNVAFTLLLGLAACHCADACARACRSREKIAPALGLTGIILAASILMTDYGGPGIMIILLFWVARGDTWPSRFAQVAGLFAIAQFLLVGQCYRVGPLELQQECFALLALPLIWLYNGSRGRKNRMLQWAAYAFYPVHLTALYLLAHTV